MDTRKLHTQKTYDAIANLYVIDFGKDREFFDLFVDPVIERIKSRKLTGAIVDLGSDPGNVVDYLLEHGIHNPIIAVDFSTNFYNLLCRKYNQLTQVKIINDDMIHWVKNYGDQNASAFVANYSFIHIPDEQFDQLLLDIHRCLRSGGFLSFAVWGGVKKGMEAEPYQVQNDQRLKEEEKLESYLNNFTEAELIERLTKAGFINIFIKTFKTKPSPGEFDHSKIIAYAEKEK